MLATTAIWSWWTGTPPSFASTSFSASVIDEWPAVIASPLASPNTSHALPQIRLDSYDIRDLRRREGRRCASLGPAPRSSLLGRLRRRSPALARLAGRQPGRRAGRAVPVARRRVRFSRPDPIRPARARRRAVERLRRRADRL